MKTFGSLSIKLILVIMCLLTWTASSTNNECSEEDSGSNKTEAKKLHLVAIFAILAAGTFGCSIPTLGQWFPTVSPDKDYFYLVKAFAAGVILATGFIHILPDAIEKLTSPCLPNSPWQNFPFAGFSTMMAAIDHLGLIKVIRRANKLERCIMFQIYSAVGLRGRSLENKAKIVKEGEECLVCCFGITSSAELRSSAGKNSAEDTGRVVLAGKVKPIVYMTFFLVEVADAQIRLIENSSHIGRMLLIP